MSDDKPTLRINILGKRNPRCSVCGQEFGSEGFARALIDAFALHVRRQHMEEDFNLTAQRGYASPTRDLIARQTMKQRWFLLGFVGTLEFPLRCPVAAVHRQLYWVSVGSAISTVKSLSDACTLSPFFPPAC